MKVEHWIMAYYAGIEFSIDWLDGIRAYDHPDCHLPSCVLNMPMSMRTGNETCSCKEDT